MARKQIAAPQFSVGADDLFAVKIFRKSNILRGSRVTGLLAL